MEIEKNTNYIKVSIDTTLGTKVQNIGENLKENQRSPGYINGKYPNSRKNTDIIIGNR